MYTKSKHFQRYVQFKKSQHANAMRRAKASRGLACHANYLESAADIRRILALDIRDYRAGKFERPSA